jgi:hypothetical protein
VLFIVAEFQVVFGKRLVFVPLNMVIRTDLESACMTDHNIRLGRIVVLSPIATSPETLEKIRVVLQHVNSGCLGVSEDVSRENM